MGPLESQKKGGHDMIPVSALHVCGYAGLQVRQMHSEEEEEKEEEEKEEEIHVLVFFSHFHFFQ